MFKRFKSSSAVKFNERGNMLREKGEWQAALELYERAAALDPRWSAPQYNLGLVFKSQKQWHKSIKHNQLAVVLNPKDEAAWWNLGIASTAVGDWQLARTAWRGFGSDIPICKACSEGRPHNTHDEQFAPPPGVRRIAIAAKTFGDARAVVEAWQLEHASIESVSIRELVASSA